MLLLSVSLKSLAAVAVAVLTCGTTIMVFIGSVIAGYVKSIRDDIKIFHASRIEHSTKLDSHDKRITKIEDKVFS